MTSTADPRELVAAVAAYGLPGRAGPGGHQQGRAGPGGHRQGGHDSFSGAPLADTALRDEVWAELLDRSRSQRLTGFLALAVRDGALLTCPDQAAQAAAAHREAMATVLVLEHLLLDTARLLTTEGIAVRVLKGSSVAHLDYPALELRSFGDVDLLVRAEQFDDAVAALARAGHRRRFPQPRPGFDRRFSKGTSFLTAGGTEIDLHRTFAMGPFGLTIKLDDLWARASMFRVGGVELWALGREERFLHTCFHASLGDNPPRLLALRDLAQVLLGNRLDLHLVRALAASWQADAVLARAVRLTWQTFGLDVAVSRLAAWATAYRPDHYERRALAAYTDPNGGYPARSAAALRAVPGVREKAAYVRALAFPDRDYLGPRHRSPVDRWRHGASGILRREGRT
jgi:hypothetical protein